MPSEELLKYTLRLPQELRDKLQKHADNQRRSLNNLIVVVLEGWVDLQENTKCIAKGNVHESNSI